MFELYVRVSGRSVYMGKGTRIRSETDRVVVYFSASGLSGLIESTDVFFAGHFIDSGAMPVPVFARPYDTTHIFQPIGLEARKEEHRLAVGVPARESR